MKLNDTHLVLLSRATQRNDGALDVPATLKDREKIVGQMLRVKLLEEVPARGALPVWRRDASGACVLFKNWSHNRHRCVLVDVWHTP